MVERYPVPRNDRGNPANDLVGGAQRPHKDKYISTIVSWDTWETAWGLNGLTSSPLGTMSPLIYSYQRECVANPFCEFNQQKFSCEPFRALTALRPKIFKQKAHLTNYRTYTQPATRQTARSAAKQPTTPLGCNTGSTAKPPVVRGRHAKPLIKPSG